MEGVGWIDGQKLSIRVFEYSGNSGDPSPVGLRTLLRKVSMRKPALLPLPLLILAALACSADGGNPEGRGTGQITVPDDSVTVVARNDQLTDIRDVIPMPDGTVWVLNTTEPLFMHFAADGSVLRATGRPGAGPEEFNYPELFFHHPTANELWVYDRSNRNLLVRIAPPDSGTPRREIRLPSDSIPSQRLLYPHFASNVSRMWGATSRNAFLFAREVDPSAIEVQKLWRSDIVAISPDGSFKIALPIAKLLGDPLAAYDSAAILMPYPLWDYCEHDDSFLLYDPIRNSVRHFAASGGGSVLDSLALPPEKLVTVTPDTVFRMLVLRRAVNMANMPDTAAMRAEFVEEWREVGGMFWKFFPEYAGLHCMPDNSALVQPFDIDSPNYGLGRTWLHLSKDGRTQSFVLPESFTPIRFTTDRIWGVKRDDSGVASAAWVRLPVR